MAILNIFGNYDTRDLASQSLIDFTEQRAMEALRSFARQYDEVLQEMLRNLCTIDTIAQANFGYNFGGEMQPYTEAGETEATRALDQWSVALPIRRLRDRQLYSEEWLQVCTLEDLQKDVLAAATRDYETMVKMILRSAMYSANYTFTDGIFPGSNLGSLAVKRLCNNDSAVGAVYIDGTKTDIGSLQHYIGTNEASMTIASPTAAYAKLVAVGKTKDVVMLINSAAADTIRGFTGFEPVQNARVIDPTGSYALVTSPRAIGRIEVAGCSCEVVVQPFMPTGYFFMYDRADEKPVKVREHKLAQFRGFRLVQDDTRAVYGDAALRNKRWERIAGAAVYNRPNGVAAHVAASTSYTDPTI
jgi:hypothetical protein